MVVPVIVIRCIERNQLVVIGQELLCILLVPTSRQLKVVRLEHDIVDAECGTRNKKVRLAKNVPAIEVSRWRSRAESMGEGADDLCRGAQFAIAARNQQVGCDLL